MQIVRRTNGKKRRNILTELKAPIEPEEYFLKKIKGRVCTFDSETDPFAPNREIAPFTCGLYFTDTGEYVDFWGDDCIEQFIKYISQFEPETLSIFAHNGGNFDFLFLREYFDCGMKPFIINGRLVRIEICGQEFRDSYAMIPVPLGDYNKTPIDYRCMERGFREIFEKTIREYQKDDCVFLGELVTEWLNMFGNKLTMASVALPMLRSYHGFETLNEKLDAEMRPYYFGGRNQCFATGILKGDFKAYDINSSYPNVMAKYKHPVSDLPMSEPTITEKTHFAKIRAWSLGALPIRADNGSLSFPIGTYDFYACIHEIKAGLETGTLKIKKVYHSIYFQEETSFSEFIDDFYKKRLEASANGDEIRKLFYKLVMNSSYGKFAQDPRKYESYIFAPEQIPTPLYCNECFQRIRRKEEKQPCETCDKEETSPFGYYMHTNVGDIQIYAAPQRATARGFYNVATAASITSAARAELLKGIQAATRPVYCDTDSVICEHMDSSKYGIRLDSKELGAWDVEAKGDTVAIAGKKLYAIFNGSEPIKKASKGVKLTAKEIERVANGEVIEYAHPVPKLELTGEQKFTTRKIRATA